MVFAEKVDSNNAAQNPSKRFTPSRKRIYAVFQLPPEVDDGRIFIKWFRQSPYDVRLYNSYSITPQAEHQYVWLNPKDDWQEGRYVVQVLRLDDNLSLLAEGYFDVS